MDFDLLNKYEEKFNTVFPLMEYRSASYSRINEMVQNCIEENKPVSELYPIDYQDRCY